MCGIYGYIGKLNAYKEVYNGLKQLQYRGYDSCGIAYFNNKFKINKTIGPLNNLTQPLEDNNIAFGHTRWATNGEVNLLNTHPHVSNNENFIIVHNGIISNADTLREKLINKGFTFYSQTDTEVIANLLESYTGEIATRLAQLYKDLEGSYSLIIGCKNGDLYAVKQFSPLHVLKSKNGIYISSDISSLETGELYSLLDGDILRIAHDEIEHLTPKKGIYITHKQDSKLPENNEFPHFMIKEIFETPRAIKDTYNTLKKANVSSIFQGITKLTILGCGTAYHSGLIGMHLLEETDMFEINAFLASNYIVKKDIKPNHLHIIISQSGETADCIKVAEQIKEKGGDILVITNEKTSTITKYAKFILLTNAKKEIAVASTKTYCCQCFVFAYIQQKLLSPKCKLSVNKLTEELTRYINTINIDNIANKLIDKQNMILIGTNIDYVTIMEAALKIREINYIYTLPMYAVELKHGTLSLVDSSSIIFSLNTDENNNKLKNALNEIASRGGEVISFDNFVNKRNLKNCFKPIFAIIPFQIISYKVAVLKGYNPDMPRNLAKSVTVE